MIYSSACANAIRALTHLAMVSPEGTVQLEELCNEAHLPRHFVAKIFQTLVRHGLLTSTKGRGGGFSLARLPGEITLWEIVAAVDGTREFDQCVVGIERCDDGQPCPEHDAWKAIRAQIRSYLQETDLGQMSHTLEKKLERLGKKPAKLSRTRKR